MKSSLTELKGLKPRMVSGLQWTLQISEEDTESYFFANLQALYNIYDLIQTERYLIEETAFYLGEAKVTYSSREESLSDFDKFFHKFEDVTAGLNWALGQRKVDIRFGLYPVRTEKDIGYGVAGRVPLEIATLEVKGFVEETCEFFSKWFSEIYSDFTLSYFKKLKLFGEPRIDLDGAATLDLQIEERIGERADKLSELVASLKE